MTEIKRNRMVWTTSSCTLLEYLSNNKPYNLCAESSDPLDLLIKKEEQALTTEEQETNLWCAIEAELSEYDFSIMFDYYFDGHTLKEMAIERGYSSAAAIQKQKRRIELHLKEVLTDER
jgi:DNA-directed RNA polymerase specialized sigma subunit